MKIPNLKCTQPNNKPFELTLTDCLACSGCITQAESIELSKTNNSLLISDTSAKTILISSYAKIQIYKLINTKIKFNDFESALNTFLTEKDNFLNCCELFDLSYFQNFYLNSLKEEFLRKKRLIVSDCSGFVQYVEKNGNHLIKFLSKTLTPQQIAYQFVKNAERKIVFIMQCLDKKLELGRDDFNADFSLSVDEFLKILKEAKFFEFLESWDTKIKDIFPIQSVLNLRYKSASGGNIEYLIDSLNIKVEEINKNGNLISYECELEGKKIRLIRIYGVKNVFNFLNSTRKAIDFDFAEVYLCKNACYGGPISEKDKIEFNESCDEIGEWVYFKDSSISNFNVKNERSFKNKNSERNKFTVEW